MRTFVLTACILFFMGFVACSGGGSKEKNIGRKVEKLQRQMNLTDTNVEMNYKVLTDRIEASNQDYNEKIRVLNSRIQSNIADMDSLHKKINKVQHGVNNNWLMIRDLENLKGRMESLERRQRNIMNEINDLSSQLNDLSSLAERVESLEWEIERNRGSRNP